VGEKTSIAWTDHSWNPWWGCTKVSQGCDHCYAEAFDKRVGGAHWGKDVPRRTFGDAHWREPLRWDRDAARDGVKSKVFCASMADVMDDEAPDGQRERLWALIDQTPNLIWQLLTKRPQRYSRYLPSAGFKHRNVWVGCTTEDQHNFDLRMPYLAGAADQWESISFISYEPAIGPLTMEGAEKPNWVICGGESGPGHRPMDPVWAESVKSQCVTYGIKFFMKQMSAQTPAKGADLIPAHLLIREFPEVR
jgi:protein gp37